MKTVMRLKAITIGDDADTLKFVSDEATEMPPIVTRRGGEADGEQAQLKALQFAPLAGKATLRPVDEDKNVLEGQEGALTRRDSWSVDEESGQVSGGQTWTLALAGRVEPEVAAKLIRSKNFVITFTPAQKTLEFKKPERKRNAA